MQVIRVVFTANFLGLSGWQGSLRIHALGQREV